MQSELNLEHPEAPKNICLSNSSVFLSPHSSCRWPCPVPGGAGEEPALLLFLALMETGRSRNTSRKYALLELPPPSQCECKGEKHPHTWALTQLHTMAAAPLPTAPCVHPCVPWHYSMEHNGFPKAPLGFQWSRRG